MEDIKPRLIRDELLLSILAKYPERPKVKRTPYGYIPKEGDPNLLIPDPVIIPLLDQALDQLDAGIPLRHVADWLNAQTPDGVTLSHMGLRNLRTQFRPNHVKVGPKHKPKTARRTNENRKEYNRKQKIANDKRRITAAQKRIEKNNEEIQEIRGIEPEIHSSMVVELDYSVLDEDDDREIIFKPEPGPQTAFLQAPEQEILYGGSAGGGKSYAMLADPMRYFDHPEFRGLLLRRTNDELKELKWKSKPIYTKAFPGAQWKEKDSMWVFPSGAQFWMTYLERDEDVMRYQGQSFSWIGVDELTQYPTPFAWNYLRTRLRTTADDLPTYMRATSNPGGPGHGWVKKMFIDPAPHGKPFPATNIDTGEPLVIPHGDTDFPEEQWGKPMFMRRFIPAKLSDNSYLMRDGKYKLNLMSGSDQLQRQLLYGDWNVADGAAFSEFRTDIHVIQPFEIPRAWRKFRSCDFGYSARQATAVHWYAVNPLTDQLIVYRELYVNQMTGREVARKVLELEHGESVAYGVLDSAVWAKTGQTGPSIAEEMIQAGCRWRPADKPAGSRIAGKNRIHELLRVDPMNKLPGLVFFDNCRQIIADLPVIPSDKDSDDIDPKYATDHAYDSLRYGVMSRPKSNAWDWDFNYTTKTYIPVDKIFGY